MIEQQIKEIQEYENINNVFDPFFQSPQTIVQQIQTTNQFIYVKNERNFIQIYDLKTVQNIYSLNLGNDSAVNSFVVSLDDSKIIFSISNKIMKFDLNYGQNNQISTQNGLTSQETISYSINQIIIDQNQSNVLVYGGTQFAIYKFQSLSNFKYIDLGEVISKAILSQDGKLIFINSIDQNGKSNLRVIEINQMNGDLNEIGGLYKKLNIDYFDVTSDQNLIYCFDQENQQLISINIQNMLSLYQQNLNKIDISSYSILNLPILNPPAIASSIKLQSDHILVIGIKYQGLQIFDISDQSQIELFYQINFAETSSYLDFNGINRDYLITSDYSSIQIFQSQNIQINNSIPSLFNIHLVNLIPIQQASSCLSLNNKKSIFVSTNKQLNLYSFQQQDDPFLIKSTYQLSSNSQSIIVDQSSFSLYIQSSQISNYLEYYQIDFDNNNQNQNPKLNLISTVPNLSNTKLPYGNMVRSKDGALVAVAYGNGFLLFDSSNFSKLSLITQVNSFSNQVDFLEITRNRQWIICTQINTGEYAFVNILDISIKVSYRTISVQGVVTFQNGDYAYLYSGSKGLIILDTLKLPQISIVGTLQTNSGWMNYINIFENENFLIISQASQEMILLVDIQDKTNPLILSQLQLTSDVGYSSCLSQDQKSLFILSQKGLRTLPIQSSILVNQIQYIFDSISQSYQLGTKQILKVGFSYSILLTPLYTVQGQSITNIFYYHNFEYEPLPKWITYSSRESTIYIKGTKEGLGSSEQMQIQNLNTILLQVQNPLTFKSFIFLQDTDGIDINQDKSILIFQQLREKFYITTQNLTNPLFFQQYDQISLNLQGFSGDQLALLTQLTLRKLLQSIQIVPIQFLMESSLQLDFTNPQQLINSSQNNITCQFQVIDDSFGVFVNKSYDGVYSYLSLNSKQLILQGISTRINQILYEKSLLFYNYTQLNLIKLNLIISDFVNYDVIKNFTLLNSDLNIFTIYKPVQLKLKLQDQLEKTHPNGVLFINSQVEFQFNNQTFQSLDQSNIIYLIFIKSDNNDQQQNTNISNKLLKECINSQSALGYQLIPQDFWMDIDAIYLIFKGYSSYMFYFNHYQFKIIAFDGYSFAEDEFQIQLTGIPASFIVLIILYAMGPLIIFAILFILRKNFLNLYILNKWGRKYQEQVYANSYYLKKIVFVGDNLKKAQKLMDAIIQFILHNETQFKNYCKQNIYDEKLKINSKRKYNTQLQNELEIKFSNNNAADKRKQISKNYFKSLVPQNFASQELNDQKDLALIFKQKNSNKQQFKNQQEQQINKFLEDKFQKTSKNNKNLKKLIFLFIDSETKDLSIQKITYFLKYFNIKFDFEGKTYEPDYYSQQLIDQGSIFHYCFISCISQYLLKLDYLSYQTLFHLKKLVKLYQNQRKQQNESLNQNWYTKYAYIKDQKPLSYSHITIKPYPEVFFDIDMIQSDLKIIFEDIQEIFQNKKSIQLLEEFVQQKINFGLIKQFLISKKLGLIKNKKMLQFPFKECSIHLRSSEIDIIECFKHDPSVQFYNLRYYFQKTSYQLLLNKGINLMPNWIKLEIKSQNCLVIHGIPTFYELGQLQIRIYDKKKIIVCQFSLQIQLRGQKNAQSVKSVGSQNQQNGLTFINKFSSVILSNQNIKNQQEQQQQQQQEENVPTNNIKNEQEPNIEQQNISFKSKTKRQSSIARSSFISIKLNQINEIDDQHTDRNTFKDRQDTQELDLADECAIHLNFSQHKKFKRKETIQE
ncbi:hypothetical protein ABPG74_000571 [Tetrahymena malaccensis]